jgi:HAD superfamily hydrolase (TIGR01509 family)
VVCCRWTRAPLAECLYNLDFDSDLHLYYEDVGSTLRELKALGTSVAVVNDIHFDLRPEFRRAGLIELVDDFVLSYEYGIQKPNPAIFELALDKLHLKPEEALMVGDRPRDGGAVLVGIPTLLLPMELGPNRGLNRVVSVISRS